jgi:hypothetical protein
LALLILSSTYAGLGHLGSDFCVAVNRRDRLLLKHVAGRFVLLVGKVIALRLAGDLLGRAVGPPFTFFSLNIG